MKTTQKVDKCFKNIKINKKPISHLKTTNKNDNYYRYY